MSNTRCTRFLHREILSNHLQLKIRDPIPRVINHRTILLPRHVSTEALPASIKRPLLSLPLTRNTTSAYYTLAVFIGFVGLTYASVPIYRIVCQKTGWAGTPMTDSSKFTAEHMIPVSTSSGRRIKVSFSASTSDTLPWSFRPQQREISLLPGETALAFYKAKNNSKEDIIGIATYNVVSLFFLV
jgi:Cytochrome c oxidase assembly protein CtaG/Cox11